jgi:archaellum component FlaC
MKKKNITIDDLAIMVQKGFQETAKKEEMDKRFDGVDKRFDGVDKRLDRIEKLILADHKERIEKLELEVKELKDLIAFN